MKNLMPSSTRERLLIVFLVLSVVIGGYLVLRVKTMKTGLVVLQEQLDDSRKAVKKIRPTKQESSNATVIQHEIAEMEAIIEQEQKTLSGFKKSFIDLSSSDAIPSMRSEITALSGKYNLRLLSINRSSVSLDTLAGVKVEKGEEALDRPQFDLKFSGQFFQINKFLIGLKTLPNTVVVTKMDLTANKTDLGSKGNTPLTAAFTLAF